MTRKHLACLVAYFAVLVGSTSAFGILLDPFTGVIWFFVQLLVGTMLTLGMAHDVEEDRFYLIPITRRMRLKNMMVLSSHESVRLNEKADECRKLAESYFSRGEEVQGQTLMIEAGHKERVAKKAIDNKKAYRRALQDISMKKLIK